MIEGRTRDLAMFNLAIDSKLRGCDVVKVEDIAPNDRVTVRQKKRGRPVKFESIDQTRQALDVNGPKHRAPGRCGAYSARCGDPSLPAEQPSLRRA